MSNVVAWQDGSMTTAFSERPTKYVRIGDLKVEIPIRAGSRTSRSKRDVYAEKRAIEARQDDDAEPEIVPITLTRTYISTTMRSTASITLPPMETSPPIATTTGPVASTASTSATTTTSFATSTNGIRPASPPDFPVALVASLCTLIPLSLLIIFLFYLRYRSSPTSSSNNNYVWGPLGLVRRRERDKQNPVLEAQERVDPIAEAIRQEERDRLGKLRRTGEARFYAPGVRHLVEYVGSKERMKVMIDWRDRMKVDRPW